MPRGSVRNVLSGICLYFWFMIKNRHFRKIQEIRENYHCAMRQKKTLDTEQINTIAPPLPHPIRTDIRRLLTPPRFSTIHYYLDIY